MVREILKNKIQQLGQLWENNKREVLIDGGPGVILIVAGVVSLSLAKIIPEYIGIAVAVLFSFWFTLSAGFVVGEPSVRFDIMQLLYATAILFAGCIAGAFVFAGLNISGLVFLSSLFLGLLLLMREGYRMNDNT